MRHFNFQELVNIEFTNENKMLLEQFFDIQELEYIENSDSNFFQLKFDRKIFIRLSQLIQYQQNNLVQFNIYIKYQIIIQLIETIMKLIQNNQMNDDFGLQDIWIKFLNDNTQTVQIKIIKLKQENQLVQIRKINEKIDEILKKLILNSEQNPALRLIQEFIQQNNSIATIQTNFKLLSAMDIDRRILITFKQKKYSNINTCVQQLHRYFQIYKNESIKLQLISLIMNKILIDDYQIIIKEIYLDNIQLNDRLNLNQVLINQIFSTDVLRNKNYESLDQLLENVDQSEDDRCLSNFNLSTIIIIKTTIIKKKELNEKRKQIINEQINLFFNNRKWTEESIKEMKNKLKDNNQFIELNNQIKQRIEDDCNQNINFDEFEQKIQQILRLIIDEVINNLLNQLQ